MKRHVYLLWPMSWREESSTQPSGLAWSQAIRLMVFTRTCINRFAQSLQQASRKFSTLLKPYLKMMGK